MNILIIGNGFDIAHGLPTKYSDFLDFISEFNPPKSDDDHRTSKPRFSAEILHIKEDLPKIYEDIDSLILNNLWINYFLQKQEELLAGGKDGWIDFESEISLIIRTLDEVRCELTDRIHRGEDKIELNCAQQEILDPIMIPNKLHLSSNPPVSSHLIRHFKKVLYDDLNRLTRCLEIYLEQVVSNMPCNKVPIIENLRSEKVLTFNYTNTFERVYGSAIPNIEYDYIHGKISEDSTIDSCNLVLGIDEYQNFPSRDSDNEFIQFKKFYQRIYKTTGCKYIDWLALRNANIQRMPKLKENYPLNLYFYGHSLDVTDKDILQKLILEDGAKTVIFHHNQKALGNQIANLVKVIGEEELIRRTGGTSRSITFVNSSSQDFSVISGNFIGDMI